MKVNFSLCAFAGAALISLNLKQLKMFSFAFVIINYTKFNNHSFFHRIYFNWKFCEREEMIIKDRVVRALTVCGVAQASNDRNENMKNDSNHSWMMDVNGGSCVDWIHLKWLSTHHRCRWFGSSRNWSRPLTLVQCWFCVIARRNFPTRAFAVNRAVSFRQRSFQANI